MRDSKTLAAGARLFNNSATGYIILQFEDFDGGPFGLHPRITDEGALVLVDPGRPAGYGIEVRGTSPDTLRRVARALNGLARQLESGSAADEE